MSEFDEDVWQDVHEHLLIEWQAKLFVQMWLQEKSMYYYLRVNNVLSYGNLLISSVSSASLFSTNNSIVKYAIGGLTLVSGILTAVMRHMKPAEYYQQHAITTKRYQSLMRTIDTQLSLSREMREKPAEFISRIEADISSLLDNQVNAIPSILRSFEKAFDGKIERMIYGKEILVLIQREIQTKQDETNIKAGSRKSLISKYMIEPFTMRRTRTPKNVRFIPTVASDPERGGSP